VEYLRIRALIGTLALAASGGLLLPTVTHAAHSRTSPSSDKRILLAIVNRDRASHGLLPLRLNSLLTHVALLHSKDMAAHDYFAHEGEDGSTPFSRMDRAGARYRYAGENLGTDTGSNQIAMLEAIETAMLQSPGHRANLLRATFTRVGVGIVTTPDSIYVTEDFAG
jgi:uncharacterized protein YkwD